MKSHKSAFTLIELLVVISIISMLISILLPALSRARDSAHGVQCLANLRQMGIGWTSYVDMFDGYFPPNTNNHADDLTKYGANNTWIGWAKRLTTLDLIPAVSGGLNKNASIRYCPVLKVSTPKQVNQPFLTDDYAHYFTDNQLAGAYSGSWSRPAQRLDDVNRASSVFSLADARYWVAGNAAIDNRVETHDFWANYSPSRPGTDCGGTRHYLSDALGSPELRGFRHAGGCNFLFLDGHAEHRRWEGDLGNWESSLGYGAYRYLDFN